MADVKDRTTVKESGRVTVHTTLGELIYAIAEAAEEASVHDKDVGRVTQLILNRMLKQCN